MIDMFPDRRPGPCRQMDGNEPETPADAAPRETLGKGDTGRHLRTVIAFGQTIAVKAAMAEPGDGAMPCFEDDCPSEDEGLQIDARDIAPLLGLTPERLMAELRAGHVYHSAEESAGLTDGQISLTFRYRARMARLIVEPDGSMHPERKRTH